MNSKTTDAVCYICFEPETDDNQFAINPRPCSCKGSIEIHNKCLEKTINLQGLRKCSICKTKYNIKYIPSKNGLELITKEYNNGYSIEYTINAEGQKHGTYYIKNEDGIIIQQETYANGVANGIFARFYSSGNLRSLCRCIDNKIEGEYTEWYEDGGIMEEVIYVNGLKQGDCKRWIKKNGICILATYTYDKGQQLYTNYV
jgi:antitoxin component YwqK of YwqJK toxin-antitoxin module